MEAKWLFGLRPEQCTAILHPQSLVHCLVEFNDGAMLAQLAPPSMTFPIQHALLHPERVDGTDAPIDLTRLMNLEFRPIDQVRFPLLRLAVEAMTAGGIAPAVYNAANEVAVAAFLAGQIPFLAIPRIVDQVLQRTANFEPSDLAGVLDADRAAREGAAADVQVLK
jgi:1-deoxy-D-xylulose-5-phosphate reductoisomerase